VSTGDGTVLGTTKLVDNGPPARRWNVVVMGDGYRAAQMGGYAADTQRVVNVLLSTPPYDGLRAAINVYRVDVTSTDSGADDPAECGGSGAAPRTYFDATFCGAPGVQRLLVVDDTTALAVADAQVPEWDVILVIVNSPVYGGSGGATAVFSLAPDAEEIALHELGHTAFGLADEYEYYLGCGVDSDRDVHPPDEPAEPNVTVDTNRTTLKWRQLVAAATPLPTSRNADCTQCDPQPSPQPPGTVGLYEGAHYYHCRAYRPEFDCRMRALGFAYCAVCKRRIREVLTPFLPPVPPVAATAWAPRRVDLFIRGADRAGYHKWFDGTGWGPSLGGAWERQGGILLGPPEAVSWGQGRLDVFAVGTNRALYHKSFEGTWAPSLSGWERLGGTVLGQPEAVSWEPGRLDVLVVGDDRALYHRWFSNGSWAPHDSFERLGGVATSQPHAVAWEPRRLDVFVLGGDRALYHKWFDGTGWRPPGAFERLGGELSGEPAVVSWAPDRLDLFAVGPDRALLHKFWDGGAWQPSASGWSSLGGAVVGEPAVVSWAADRLDVFHVSGDQAVYHKWWDGAAWRPSASGWQRLGGTAVGAVSAVAWEPRRLDLFHVGGDLAVYHKWFDGSAWRPSLGGAWQRLGGSADF
jgi:IgA Peptidase M64/Repeat of unknown function (DUF346)